jgi:hypothetical protein
MNPHLQRAFGADEIAVPKTDPIRHASGVDDDTGPVPKSCSRPWQFQRDATWQILASSEVAAFRAAFTGAFSAAAFLAAGGCRAFAAVAASALTLAQRLLVAFTMAFLPAALSFRYDAKKKGTTICPMRRVVCQLPQRCGA